jgi:hypothetical protein
VTEHHIESCDEMAAREGFPIVALSRHDLLHMLAGHPMVHGDLAGGRVTIRLATAEELIDRNAAAIAALGVGVPMTREQAIAQSTPVDVDVAVGKLLDNARNTAAERDHLRGENASLTAELRVRTRVIERVREALDGEG